MTTYKQCHAAFRIEKHAMNPHSTKSIIVMGKELNNKTRTEHLKALQLTKSQPEHSHNFMLSVHHTTSQIGVASDIVVQFDSPAKAIIIQPT